MRVLITESRLYNAFKGWMDSELKNGILEWRMDSSGTIYLMKNEDDVVLVRTYKTGRVFVDKNLFSEIEIFFPIEKYDILKMIGGYVARKVNQPVDIPVVINDKIQPYGETFPI